MYLEKVKMSNLKLREYLYVVSWERWSYACRRWMMFNKWYFWSFVFSENRIDIYPKRLFRERMIRQITVMINYLLTFPTSPQQNTGQHEWWPWPWPWPCLRVDGTLAWLCYEVLSLTRVLCRLSRRLVWFYFYKCCSCSWSEDLIFFLNRRGHIYI
jgi:hypothetical protein